MASPAREHGSYRRHGQGGGTLERERFHGTNGIQRGRLRVCRFQKTALRHAGLSEVGCSLAEQHRGLKQRMQSEQRICRIELSDRSQMQKLIDLNQCTAPIGQGE